tara:strand:+ start:395 stop:664 length:270 start_codon:yes stop_codon:yes gene_type:complete
MKIHWKISLFGKVQGVWFRKHTLKEAEELGLKGFVKNLNDGSVYIEVEGEEAVVSKFVAWCSRGPELANVKKVSMTKSDLQGFNSFVIA